MATEMAPSLLELYQKLQMDLAAAMQARCDFPEHLGVVRELRLENEQLANALAAKERECERWKPVMDVLDAYWIADAGDDTPAWCRATTTLKKAFATYKASAGEYGTPQDREMLAETELRKAAGGEGK